MDARASSRLTRGPTLKPNQSDRRILLSPMSQTFSSPSEPLFIGLRFLALTRMNALSLNRPPG